VNVAHFALNALPPGKGEMTVEVARRRTRKPKVASMAESLAIGEINQTVFACPACARPLALGARHCPGCGTRLILGVQAQRASLFAGVGLVTGIVLSGLLGAATSAIGSAGRDAEAAAAAALDASNPLPSIEPTVAPSASPAPSIATGSTSTVPPLSRSALGQAAAVHERLAASSSTLAAVLAAERFDTFPVSQVLRATSADAVVGLQLTPVIGAWSGGAALSADLRAFYLAIQETAAEGLSASIRNEAAYRAAAEEMTELLAGLDAIDAELRDVAGRARVTLTSTP
jgi:hypothetical protein